jgi:hypothetical protein
MEKKGITNNVAICIVRLSVFELMNSVTLRWAVRHNLVGIIRNACVMLVEEYVVRLWLSLGDRRRV